MRFPEFSGKWGKYTLGDIGDTYNGLTGKSAVDFGSGSPFITYKSIFDNSKIDVSKIEYVRITDAERAKQTQNEVKYGDIFFTTSSETPNEVGMASVLLTDISDCYLNSFCFGYRIIDKVAYRPEFFRFYLHSNKVRRNIAILAQGSTRFNISKNEVMRVPINLPEYAEQRKVAQFLSLIEERISTQNKIIEDLKKLKSAIVEMLLCNQSGESFKLGDVGCFVRGLTYANEDVTEDKAATIVIRANNLNYGSYVDKGEVVYVNKTPTVSQILRKGDIVICMANGSSALVGKNSYYPFNDRQSTIGAFCGIYRTSSHIVKWLMQSQRYKKQVYQSLQGGNGAIANLNGDDILNMSFPLIEKEKSQSIIFTIEAIEKSLAVNKCLHRLYCTQKSYLLKQMFI